MRQIIWIIAFFTALATTGARVGDVVFVSDNGAFELHVTDAWSNIEPTQKTTVLKIENKESGGRLAVVPDPKDVDYDTKLDGYAERCKAHFVEILRDFTISKPTPMKVGNYRAIVYEIKGVDKESDWKGHFLLVVVEADKNFVQLIGSSSQSKFAGARAGIEQAMQGFREVEKKQSATHAS